MKEQGGKDWGKHDTGNLDFQKQEPKKKTEENGIVSNQLELSSMAFSNRCFSRSSPK
jgi:hypothetical protein